MFGGLTRVDPTVKLLLPLVPFSMQKNILCRLRFGSRRSGTENGAQYWYAAGNQKE